MNTIIDGYEIAEVRRDSNALYGDGVYAMVRDTTDGSTLHLSQLDGETYWVADGLFGPGSFPHWCHGFGSRYTLLKTVSNAELVSALDAAKAALV